MAAQGFANTIQIWAAITSFVFSGVLLTLRPCLPLTSHTVGTTRGQFMPLDLSFLYSPTVILTVRPPDLFLQTIHVDSQRQSLMTFVFLLSYFPVSLYIPTCAPPSFL
jgi:hypothetical protein